MKTLCSNTSPACNFYDGSNYVVGGSVGHLLHQLVYSMKRDIELRMAAHDLTAAQWYPLWKLKLGSSCTAQQLAREMAVDAGSMTRLIDRLEAKGLIERVRSSTDRRVVDLALTAAGRAVAEHIPQVLADVNNHYLRGFSKADWVQLRGLLDRMLAQSPHPLLPYAVEPTTDAAADPATDVAAESESIEETPHDSPSVS